MKVNVNIEIDDARRNALAQLLDGKPVKRMATRDEVRDLVVALIESLAAAQVYPPAPVPEARTNHPAHDALPAAASARIEELRAEGKGEDYIQSWLRGFLGKRNKGFS